MSLSDRLDEDRRKRMLDGDTAMAWLKRHEGIERWRDVGQSANDLMSAVMESAGATEPVGAGYNRAWKELASRVPNIRGLSDERPRPCNVDGKRLGSSQPMAVHAGGQRAIATQPPIRPLPTLR
jgi:hypothetical protein